MTTLAEIDTALRRPDLTPLDRASLLLARKRAFMGYQSKQDSTTNPSAFDSPLPEGPKGED
ncbi:MAG: hypothetical protein F4Y03_07780 [Alphaproteobacteria bacterium]|nr:hypothetical protein [Alphaproteobacteria bacterium]